MVGFREWLDKQNLSYSEDDNLLIDVDIGASCPCL